MKTIKMKTIKISLLLSILISSITFGQFVPKRIPTGGNANQNPIEQQMIDKAKQFNMGNPAANTPHIVGIANGGYFMSFANGGNVYYNPTTKAVYAVYGDIFRKYGELGWENGELGYPTSDEKDSDKAGWKRMNTFDKGAIYWNDGRLEVVKKSKFIKDIATSQVNSEKIGIIKMRDFQSVTKSIIEVNSGATQGNYKPISESSKPGKQSFSEDNSTICTTTYKRLEVTNLSQDVLSSSEVSLLQLGGIYDLGEFKKGNITSINSPRNELNISIDKGGVLSEKISNPNNTTLADGLVTIRNKKFVDKPGRGEQLYICKIVNSEDELNLAAAVSYNGYGVDLKATFGYNSKSKTNKYLVTYTNPVYTVKVNDYQNPFIDNNLNKDKNLVMVSSLTYGARLLVYFESNLDEKTITASFSGSGYGVTAKANAEIKKALSEINYKIYLVGSFDGIKTANGYEELHNKTQEMINNMYNKNATSFSSYGDIISYSLRFLDGKIAATKCSAQDIPSYTCVPNPDIPMNLTINLINVHTSDYGFYGWNDAEIIDEKNEIVDTKTFFDFGKKENMGTTNTNENSPYRKVIFNNLSKATRDGGKLKLWFWINNGEQGHYCNILGHTQSNYAKRGGNHYFVEYNLRDLMLPTKTGEHEDPHRETVNAKADSGKRTSMDFNYNFIFSK